MRITVALGILFAALLPNLSFADKITYDPNLVNPANSTESISDERLEQKITYTAKNKRLHTVLEEISKQTGVVIRSGINAKDWQVRDLPVFVCVKDMPLGDLLDHISGVTHLLLTSTMVGDKPQYRMWLDAARRKQIEDYLAKKKDNVLAEKKWEWDAWIRCGSIPQDELNKSIERHMDETGGTAYPDERTIDSAARIPGIMADLPAEVKDAVFAGDVVKINAKDASWSLREKITGFYRSQWEHQQQELERYALEDSEYAKHYRKIELKESDMESASLIISSDTKYPSVDARVSGGMQSFGFPLWMLREIKHPAVSAMLDEHEKLTGEQLAQEQKLFEALSFECPSGFADINYVDESEDKSVKIKIQKPAENGEIRYSDIMELISKASGYSIVSEDFKSKEPYYFDDEETIFGHEITLKQALRNCGYAQWYANDNDKVTVGSDTFWIDRHKNLMPEKLLVELSNKLNTTGVDLDDVVPLVGYTQEQLSEWISEDRDLRSISLSVMDDDREFWRLYDALSPSGKAAAKSEKGVPVAKVNPNLTSEVFGKAAFEKHRMTQMSGDLIGFGRAMMSDPKSAERIFQWVMQQHPELGPRGSDEESSGDDSVPDFDPNQIISEIKQQFPEYFAPVFVPTNPYEISKLRLRIVNNDFPDVCMEDPDAKMSEIEKKHSYRMEITGDNTNISVPAPCYAFPIYSEKRLTQLYKEHGLITEVEDRPDGSLQK